MGRFRIRKIVTTERDIDLSLDDVMTLTEAAEEKGVVVQTVASAVSRGTLTAIIDTEAPNPQQQRRLVLRSEVASWSPRRARHAGK